MSNASDPTPEETPAASETEAAEEALSSSLVDRLREAGLVVDLDEDDVKDGGPTPLTGKVKSQKIDFIRSAQVWSLRVIAEMEEDALLQTGTELPPDVLLTEETKLSLEQQALAVIHTSATQQGIHVERVTLRWKQSTPNLSGQVLVPPPGLTLNGHDH